ncbi:MAG TPA: DUF1801 domain-containing protein [Cryobacterium sp.]|nr:DUF1801 domain-containing protein [Cryobacterium sp.]
MNSIEESLAAVPQPERDALQNVIAIARRLAPDAVDGVSYGLPTLKVNGSPLVAVAASAQHLSVFPFSPAAIDAVRSHLEGFSLSKGTIRFTPDHPVPDDVLEQIVQARLAEITG